MALLRRSSHILSVREPKQQSSANLMWVQCSASRSGQTHCSNVFLGQDGNTRVERSKWQKLDHWLHLIKVWKQIDLFYRHVKIISKMVHKRDFCCPLSLDSTCGKQINSSGNNWVYKTFLLTIMELISQCMIGAWGLLHSFCTRAIVKYSVWQTTISYVF